ncbi:MAG TPA: hypothetical protein PLF50_05685 [Candidatus Cloacimonadota bacterium]|nr:hypothetical protein [Candidatus Cloacimonadota bacterium]
MKDKLDFVELTFMNPQDVKNSHKKIFSIQSSMSTIIEWQCLLNTLKKNLFIPCIDPLLYYPYRILKIEEPDFEIELSSGEVMLIEVTRATTMRNEALRHLLSKAGDYMAEVSNDMFTLEKPNKGEMRKNLIKNGASLQDTEIYGWYAEKQWASIIVSAIVSKRNKVYSDKVDLLLIEDRSLLYHSYREVIKRFEFLKSAIESDPKTLEMNVFPNIITDTFGAIGMIRKDNQWLFNPLFLPDGWMED